MGARVKDLAILERREASVRGQAIAHEVVGLDECVVQPARRQIFGARMPIETRPPAMTRHRDKVGDQRAPDSASARGGIDEQVLQIAYGRLNKGPLVQQRMGESQQPTLFLGEPAQNRRLGRDDPSPCGGGDMLGQTRLIKFRVAALKPTPLRFVVGTRRSDPHRSLRLVVQ
jgi:hypothetical protein